MLLPNSTFYHLDIFTYYNLLPLVLPTTSSTWTILTHTRTNFFTDYHSVKTGHQTRNRSADLVVDGRVQARPLNQYF